MRPHANAGGRLLLAGLALGAVYAVLVWVCVFENEDAHQVCGADVPHRDNFFPPYTSCGMGPGGYRMTSPLEEYTGAILFVMAVALFVVGALMLIRSGRARPRPGRPAATRR